MAWGPPQPPTPDPECFPPVRVSQLLIMGVSQRLLWTSLGPQLCGGGCSNPHMKDNSRLYPEASSAVLCDLEQRSQRSVRPQPRFGEGTREWKNEQMNWGSARYCVEYLANITVEYLANSTVEYQTDSLMEYNCIGHT